MESLFAKYGYTPDKESISKRLDAIAANIDNVTSPEVLKNCMALMDLTTLHTEDSPESVKKLVGKVNSFMNDALTHDVCRHRRGVHTDLTGGSLYEISTFFHRQLHRGEGQGV